MKLLENIIPFIHQHIDGFKVAKINLCIQHHPVEIQNVK
jgi:hypothetical protein